jgi:magnesium-transporting ATPase (P-type)
VINFFFLRATFMKLRSMTENRNTVKVIRNGQRVLLSVKELVPGDVYLL